MRSARFGRIPFTEAIGCHFNPLIQEWLLIGEQAENEAEAALIKQAREQG